jgi:RNA polymerase sigma-70 factor, ECF subfamily
MPTGARPPDPGTRRDRRGRVTTASAASVEVALGTPSVDAALALTPAPTRFLDEESRAWLHDLRAQGPARAAAVERLHALLLRAARFEFARRRPSLPHVRGNEFGEIALEAADDALMSVLARLDDFRGDSRFSTWVYKFALLEAAVKLRKRAWQGREIPLEQESWDLFSSAGLGPADAAEQSELLAALQEGIAALTPHQRRVLVALAVNGVPIDVLADRLNTNRGALYKTLHDARRNLRTYLTNRGLDPLVSFEESH